MSQAQNYQTLKLVASGGTAVLYKAIQTSLDRTVAIKRLHQHLTEDENFTRRFILEAKAAASLDHDNIVKIIDFGNDDDSYYMVMEYIEGESLREILDRWKQIPVEVALALTYHVLQGLEHAHAKGIVHRDIKPGNIMITRHGKVKITDFGLAKLTQGATHHTADNSILGTPLYMSPEQAFGQSVDHRSDLFSLGTMLYELVTGVQPFREENYMAVIQNIINRNAPHPSKFDVDVPQAVAALLSKAMNKSREARFQSAGDFKAAIEKYLGLSELKHATETLRQLLNTDGETIVLPRTIKDQSRQRRLRRGLIAAVTAATLFGAAGFGYTLAPDRVQQQLDGVVEWLEKGRRQRRIQTAEIGMAPGAYLDALMPDTVFVQPKPPPKQAPPKQAPPKQDPAPPVKTPTPTPPPAQNDPKPVQREEEPAPEARSGWLSVSVEPWAEVYVNGQYRSDSPPTARIRLPQGRHTLECRNPKYRTYSEDVRIVAGELSRRRIVLEKLVGKVALTTDTGAEVYVDGVLVGTTPLGEALELGVGEHQITIKKPGYNVWNNKINVRANETFPLRITLSKMY